MIRSEIENFLSRLKDINALVIGDLMLDEYLWGKAERISPEAPVQVVDVTRADLRLGGAGNVVNNLVALGCRVEVVSVLGEDDDGHLLRSLLVDQGIAVDGIFSDPGRVTSRKTRVLAGNQQMLRIDRESKDPILEDLARRLLDHVRAVADGFQVILVSDYLKGVLTDFLLRELIALGREKGIPVVIDPKGDDYGKYRGATLLTPNRKEAQTASGVAIVDEASLLKAGRALRERLELDALVLTRSEEGMSLFLRDGRELHMPTKAREVFDVSGAGDTVLSVIGVGLAAGLSLEQAATVSNLAAGVVVGKVGTSTVSPEEILQASGAAHADGDLKIRNREALATVLDRERRQGRRIVFTNGCFDLLHVGHVKYLQAARRLGDLLVLGLNSDDSIRRLKGPNRPLISQDERAHILAALDCINHVVIFDEDTPLELIRLLRPDILVKGGDYTPEGVVGKDLVESWGGRVELIQFVDGKSTTGIVEKILRQYREE
ncbi:bifunctional D-glycero-beta-D-manno-heptose-7-phosphate kinase/D-glycero-beta-D-manno-heptose 1-phosphate adenylyltransferase HldE [Trichloromonas sp.]|uniref:bifunctional D-glycero-beta-D-manno-heptose-7-phosphate kinase/D-glycero-beta-D-manno-heptose 1-phosphate adenylyltransferase HldE n=1 Tax=Trichloromonas sp. TaxID=3069249 RepID=UPI002A3EB87E|nr:bifunctional D-glycero-beta-D-manno-heptose-7-phosphate kinase/D-glycero-beta-D-manno-heptose 1-phosphate adenylyltransferase HldE [Trichloromonas sp.]